MSIAGLLVIAVFMLALAGVVGRWAIANPLPALGRAFVGVTCGGLGGLSIGLLVGSLLGRFLGLDPGAPQNIWAVAICLGLLGIVMGSLGGLLYAQRLQPPAGP